MERNDSPTNHAIQHLLVRGRTGRLCSIPEGTMPEIGFGNESLAPSLARCLIQI
jgi:hypothetical protein